MTNPVGLRGGGGGGGGNVVYILHLTSKLQYDMCTSIFLHPPPSQKKWGDSIIIHFLYVNLIKMSVAAKVDGAAPPLFFMLRDWGGQRFRISL